MRAVSQIKSFYSPEERAELEELARDILPVPEYHNIPGNQIFGVIRRVQASNALLIAPYGEKSKHGEESQLVTIALRRGFNNRNIVFPYHTNDPFALAQLERSLQGRRVRVEAIGSSAPHPVERVEVHAANVAITLEHQGTLFPNGWFGRYHKSAQAPLVSGPFYYATWSEK